MNIYCKTLWNDTFLEQALLCCSTEHKWCYPHLIPAFLVSMMTRVMSHKAGLVRIKANFGFNPHGFSQWRLKFKQSSSAVISYAVYQSSKDPFFCPGLWINMRHYFYLVPTKTEVLHSHGSIKRYKNRWWIYQSSKTINMCNSHNSTLVIKQSPSKETKKIKKGKIVLIIPFDSLDGS